MKLIESTPVEIVITDIFMEPMNGYELIKSIRTKEEYKKIPIIAVTESDQASRKMALKARKTNRKQMKTLQYEIYF